MELVNANWNCVKKEYLLNEGMKQPFEIIRNTAILMKLRDFYYNLDTHLFILMMLMYLETTAICFHEMPHFLGYIRILDFFLRIYYSFARKTSK